MKLVSFDFFEVFQKRTMIRLGYLTEETGILLTVKTLPSSPVL